MASRVLDQLEFKEDFFGSAIKKRVAVICARGDKTEDEYRTEVEKRIEPSDILKDEHADQEMLWVWEWNERVLSRITLRPLNRGRQRKNQSWLDHDRETFSLRVWTL